MHPPYRQNVARLPEPSRPGHLAGRQRLKQGLHVRASLQAGTGPTSNPQAVPLSEAKGCQELA